MNNAIESTQLLKGIPNLMTQKNATNNGNTILYHQLKNPSSIDNNIPYMKATEDYLQNTEISHNRIILVSDEPGIARKAAARIAVNPLDKQPDSYYDDNDPFDEDELDEYFDVETLDDMNYDKLDITWLFREVNFSWTSPDEKLSPLANPFFMQLEEDNNPFINLYVTGLENPDDRDSKLDAIASNQHCKEGRVILLVPCSQKDSLWVKNLLRTENYSILELPDCTDYLRDFLPSKASSLDPKLVNDAYNQARIDHGNNLTEEILAWYLADPRAFPKEKKSAIEELSVMPGLKNAKDTAEELAAIVMEKMNNSKLKSIRNHMLFYGNPGTGKTTVAKKMARILAETCNTRSTLVTVSRSDLIGKYVGHTAPKVTKKFEEARGGVLFVDEAGFFLSERGNAGYTSEAIREFVRYMEAYDDVTVIFALYKNEVEDFLNLDEGLRSRICRQVEFCDYSDKELINIAKTMCEDRGYRLSSKALPLITDYLSRLRRRAKNTYGNAREVRKLIESAIFRHALRMKNQNGDRKNADILTINDVIEGINRLEPKDAITGVSFGFAGKNKTQSI